MKHVQNCIMLVERLGSVFHDLVVLMLVYVKKVYVSKLIKNQTKVLRLKLFTNVWYKGMYLNGHAATKEQLDSCTGNYFILLREHVELRK